jgi:hypothetical protein
MHVRQVIVVALSRHSGGTKMGRSVGAIHYLASLVCLTQTISLLDVLFIEKHEFCSLFRTSHIYVAYRDVLRMDSW